MTTLRAVLLVAIAACGGHQAKQDARVPDSPIAIDAPPDAPAAVPNLSLSGSGLAHTEPSIAVDPNDSHRLVAAWMYIARLSPLAVDIETRASSDGGATWSPTVTLPHLRADFHSADVSVAFDRHGVAHLTFIDFAGDSETSGGITAAVVAHTRADALAPLTWTAPTVVRDLAETSDVAIDRPWVAVDTSGGARDGAIYVATRSADATPAGIARHMHLKTSVDGGATWSADILVAGDAYPDFASPFGQAVVDASGAVVVIYGAASGPSCGVVCLAAARSVDGGATFTRAFAAHVVPTPNKGDYFFRIAAAGGPAGRFAAAWNDGRSDAADILVVHSDDTGATWSAPVRANDDAAGAGQDFPWLAFAPSGRLAAAWRDRRAAGAGPYTTPFEVYFATSDDGGATFSANRRLSDATSPSPAIESGNDFIGVAAAPDAIHAVWGDHRTGAWSVFHGVASP